MNRLVLHPANATYAPQDWLPIINELRAITFLGDEFISTQGAAYFAGERFLSLLSFLGCAPNIKLAPEAGDTAFCYILFSSITKVRFRQLTSQTIRARCPHCGAQQSDWPMLLEQWRENPENTQFSCDKCQVTDIIYALNWRNKAAFGRLFIDICNIYPQEAIPTEQLLAALERVSQQPWHYFYTT